MSALETRVEVVNEPRTYERWRPISYFRDLLFTELAEQGVGAGSGSEQAEARERLQRHAQEMDLERRTNPNRVQGQGGYFAPPLWLIDQFAAAPRPNRVLAKMIDKAGCAFPMPPGVQSINLPRMTTGNLAQGSGDLEAAPSQDVVDASLTSPVVTIVGNADVALQELEQSPAGAHLDTMFSQDLAKSYDANLETMLINGTGPNTQPTEQFTGLLNLPNTVGVTFTNASPTAVLMFPFLGQVISRVGNNRKHPPEAWLMTTSRAGWLGSSEDAQNRPLMIADNTAATGEFDLLAFPVGIADAIPTTLGAGGNQDAIIAWRPSDCLLFESTPRIQVMTEILSGTLQARLQYRGYAAFICRYPSGVSPLTGTGMVVQSNFNN